MSHSKYREYRLKNQEFDRVHQTILEYDERELTQYIRRESYIFGYQDGVSDIIANVFSSVSHSLSKRKDTIQGSEYWEGVNDVLELILHSSNLEET